VLGQSSSGTKRLPIPLTSPAWNGPFGPSNLATSQLQFRTWITRHLSVDETRTPRARRRPTGFEQLANSDSPHHLLLCSHWVREDIVLKSDCSQDHLGTGRYSCYSAQGPTWSDGWRLSGDQVWTYFRAFAISKRAATDTAELSLTAVENHRLSMSKAQPPGSNGLAHASGPVGNWTTAGPFNERFRPADLNRNCEARRPVVNRQKSVHPIDYGNCGLE
jgi:hypothetical protein